MMAPESIPAGAEMAVKALAGELSAKSFKPRLWAAARVASASIRAFAISFSRPSRRMYSSAAWSATTSVVAGVKLTSPLASAFRSRAK